MVAALAIALVLSGQERNIFAEMDDLRRRAAALASGEYAAQVRAEDAQRLIVNRTESEFRTAGRQVVLDTLRDPASAQFRNVRRSWSPNGSATFCGQVNARNGFGGYTGFQRFISGATPSGRTSVQIDDQGGSVGDYFERVWRSDCVDGEPVAF